MQHPGILDLSLLRALQTIERTRIEVILLRLPPAVTERLRQQGWLRSTHFSISALKAIGFRWPKPNRSSSKSPASPAAGGISKRSNADDLALNQVEAWAEEGLPSTEERIRKLHALLYRARRAHPTPYRDGQYVIHNEVTGRIVYLPPEAENVPLLMREWVA